MSEKNTAEFEQFWQKEVKAKGYAYGGIDYHYALYVWEEATKPMQEKLDEQAQETEALYKKLQALSAHETCACSFDKPDDLCLHHSPKLVEMQAKLDEQAEELSALRKEFADRQQITRRAIELAKTNAALRGFAKTLYEKHPDMVDYFIDFNLIDADGKPTPLLTGEKE